MAKRWQKRPAGSNWGEFGDDDQRGRLNLLTAKLRLRAMDEVKTGEVFCLSHPLDRPGGSILNANRKPPVFHPVYRGSEVYFNLALEKSDPRYFNFEMDVFWVKHPGQDPVALLQKYPNRFPLMHLKDRRRGTVGNQNGEADVETNVVLGTGDVGIAAIMKAAKKAGVRHYFIEDESSRSVSQVPKSLAYLRSLKP